MLLMVETVELIAGFGGHLLGRLLLFINAFGHDMLEIALLGGGLLRAIERECGRLAKEA